MSRGRRGGKGALALCALLVLSGCSGRPGGPELRDAAPPGPTLVLTSPVPRPNPLARLAPIRETPIATSAELSRAYDRFEGELVAQGLLREDAGSLERLDPAALTTNFLRIALYDEYTPVEDGFLGVETQSRLRRWEAPVRLSMSFGGSVPETQRRADLEEVDRLIASLAEATGHRIGRVEGRGNFTVFVVNEQERLALRPVLARLVPGIGDGVVREVLDILPSTFCLVVAFSNAETPSVYAAAIAIVRAEHPPRLRRSCFHEEIAQGLGLPNDSDTVRPSVFNDSYDFAVLTAQDLLFLRILYDDRLRPGMALAEAEPIVAAISEEVLPTDLAVLHLR